ncbi:MAG: alanine racemase [Cyclobacteriaceae bacterium]
MHLTKPTLLIDEARCRKNIKKMAQKAKSSGSILRPHFKTHHSAEIGNWFRDFEVSACTASSVSMAEYFAKNGWNDITIAFPFNPLEAEEISRIAKTTTLNILIESAESLRLANEKIQHPVGYFLKIDIGTHRTGIGPANIPLIETLVNASSKKVNFRGFLAHAGHTYYSSQNEIEKIFKESGIILGRLKSQFGGIISYGDTPSCSMMNDLSAFDEIRAGNFVFYDWMQKIIGSCQVQDISVCLACPVVAIHEERNEVVVYGGGVHLSKEQMLESGEKCFGKAVSLTENGWGDEIIGTVTKLSQEHGLIRINDARITRIKTGDLIGVIPVHSCLAADLQGHYYTTKGQKIEKIIKE